MYDNKQIQERLSDLHDVLYYCSEQQKEGRIYIFTVNERICINQERGSLLSQINKDNFPHEVRDYKISSALQVKVQITINKLEQTSWRHLIQNPFINANN